MTMINNISASKAVVLLGLLLLNACSSKETGKNSGQVIAKVNGEEISVHQINFILSRTSEINQDNVETAKKEIINTLVEQSLLNQQAMTDKMDRNPEIMMAIEHAKRQLLAEAWLDKATRNVKQPTEQEIEQYYQSHPELFAQHKTFKLKEVLIGKADGKQNRINQHLSTSKQVDELINKLDTDKIAYQVNLTTQAAENLPLEQLPALQTLKEGQFISIGKDNGTLVLAVLASLEDPIDKNKAMPIIETFLLNQQRKTLVGQTLKKLKANVKVEFFGEFAAMNSPMQPTQTGPAKIDDIDKDAIISKGVKNL